MICASGLLNIRWIFSPGSAGVLGNESANVLAGAVDVRRVLILDHPAVPGGFAFCVMMILSSTH